MKSTVLQDACTALARAERRPNETRGCAKVSRLYRIPAPVRQADQRLRPVVAGVETTDCPITHPQRWARVAPHPTDP
jgi:hypothetical protein